MAKKSSVYFGKPLIELINDRKKGSSVSGKINKTADRYMLICKNHGVKLTANECAVLCNFLEGKTINAMLIKHLFSELEQHETTKIVAKKTLINKLAQHSIADIVAMIESLGF